MGLTDYSRMDKEFFESGVRAERERIIELLETNYKGPNGLLWTERDLRSLIALIKGENK